MVLLTLGTSLLQPIPCLYQSAPDPSACRRRWCGTHMGHHLVTFYVWPMATSASSVLAHTGYRSCRNDPGKHDLHHERAFNLKTAVNFGTMGVFDWLHGMGSSIPKADAKAWRAQRDRQAAVSLSRRSRWRWLSSQIIAMNGSTGPFDVTRQYIRKKLTDRKSVV